MTRSILFQGWGVRAILEDRKTQTRRVIKPQPHWRMTNPEGRLICKCPYGQPGDRLWVRETFVLENTSEYHGDHKLPTDGRPYKTIPDDGMSGEYCLIPYYKATDPEPNIVPYDRTSDDPNDDRTRWKPAIHMPRWASRITLEIVSVRVERVQEIHHNEKDLRADGMELPPSELYPHINTADKLERLFVKAWNSIYGKGSRDKNPWVWVVEFRRI